MLLPDPPMLLEDEEEFGEAAEAMVGRQLRQRGITDPAVLQAMRCVPRHAFLDPFLRRRAYEDCALPTLHDQTISQPFIVGLMTQMLDVHRSHRVLEIGTGSGYQTAILSALAGEVVSIEREADLADHARHMLERFGIENVTVRVGDGTLGWAERSPYDRILVTAGAPDVPPPLIEQLAEGGRMVIPVGDRKGQTLIRIDKIGGRLTRGESTPCRFVPLIGARGWSEIDV